MSELTSYNSERIYWAVEQVEREAGDIDDLHLDDNLFYLKSEADKVIAEKNKEIAELKEQIEVLLAMVEMLELICPITIRKAKWKCKWHKRWLEIAEKFKPNKEA